MRKVRGSTARRCTTPAARTTSNRVLTQKAPMSVGPGGQAALSWPASATAAKGT